jgi:hypothetical protein
MKRVMIKFKGEEPQYFLAEKVEDSGMRILLKDSEGKLTGSFSSDRVESFGIVAD